MKYLLKNIACAILLLTVFNCTTESVDNPHESLEITQSQETNSVAPTVACSGDSPKARITNNGTLDVNLEIYNESGALVGHEYGIEPGEHSDWKSFSAGETTFAVSNVNADKIIVLDMDACMVYNMVVGENNQLTSSQPTEL